ncbi:ammonium transporter [Aeromonas salmonicida subsp. salmonicida]|uniref:Ammonium transporter n=2 Tax=Aeromonas salmonicida subsp. salmonicida TaxID=29491 RepID=A4SRV2_AERS4|nr:ammonium transporter [Aeromonas salmonicida]ABO91624.1 ammonium transporter [Aeromonas salmonicida subsp. salmonicida A449]AYO64618.1 ammonium transporter [Aeromonas salmonicida subsp. salmonicida 01-B526]EHI50486.1 ammonium transporter [Aeromonas salmonicida subsp. salmonicida 01-B526]EKP0240356.1 ammonium transporter [Aeromonas salmonicida]EKP0244538.1 ammonium transporter [Aeromonas salmonicida]
MLKRLVMTGLLALAALLASPSWAEEVIVTASVDVVQAAVPAVTINKGDNTWMLLSAALVILMSIPGLALFYGGLVRSKNMLSVLMQVFTLFSLICVLWVIYGYSLAFTEGNSLYGSFSKVLLKGVTPDSIAATFSKGVGISEFIYVVFQGAFAAITCGLIVGAFAERIKFAAVLLFSVIWFTFAYIPLAHMVWYWAGPDAYTTADAAAAATATAGYLFQHGALLTGVFASPDLGGTGVWDYVTNQVAEGYSILTQVKIQAIGVGVTILWSGVISVVAFKLVDLMVGLRVKEDAEREGLDVTTHGEKAYSL